MFLLAARGLFYFNCERGKRLFNIILIIGPNIISRSDYESGIFLFLRRQDILMNFTNIFRQEQTKELCGQIVNYIGNDPAKFGKLMEIFFGEDDRLAQKAAWPASYCVRAYPKLAEPYLDRFAKLLDDPLAGSAVLRNTVRLLQDIIIPNKFQGQIMNSCFNLIQCDGTAGAVKAFSLTILKNLATFHPEILPEIKLIIEKRWDVEKPAFCSRARRILEMK